MDDSSAELDFGADDIPAIVAHDIKNPLQCIQGYAAMLARGTVDQGKVRVMAERILSCGDRIEAITNDLLRQRDADAKALRFDPKPVVLADAVREVVESFGAVCQEKRIKLSWAPASRLEAIVADARRIQQAVANLVGNAVAHVAPDGTIEVSLHDGGDEFVIAVADNGTGVALEQQGRLFEKGYQVRDGRQGSLGLGLHVAKLVAEGHGGRVWMQSGGLGKGATFFLSVPTTAPAAGGSRGRAASWLSLRLPRVTSGSALLLSVLLAAPFLMFGRAAPSGPLNLSASERSVLRDSPASQASWRSLWKRLADAIRKELP